MVTDARLNHGLGRNSTPLKPSANNLYIPIDKPVIECCLLHGPVPRIQARKDATLSPKYDVKWPFPFPYREPFRKHPHSLKNLLAVAFYSDQLSNSFSQVQGYDFGGSQSQTLTPPIPNLSVIGITPGNSNNPFFLQGTWELLNGATVLAPTVAQAGPSGAFTPMYWLNSINFFANNLHVIGNNGSEFGVLRFDALTGNPNGSGTNPAADPLFLPLDVFLENTGMGLVSVSGETALVIPLATGIAACLLGGSGSPTLKGPIHYSSFQGQGLPAQLALTAPSQSSASGVIYFLYFDGFNPGGGAGLMSVNPSDVENAILLGSTNIPVTVITQLGSLPVTGAWCATQYNNADVVYLANPGWAGPTTPVYSLQMIVPSTGSISTLTTSQPGIPWGMCEVTITY